MKTGRFCCIECNLSNDEDRAGDIALDAATDNRRDKILMKKTDFWYILLVLPEVTFYLFLGLKIFDNSDLLLSR